MLDRRGFIAGLVATLAAPAIVRAESIWLPPPRPKRIWTGIDLGGEEYTVVAINQGGQLLHLLHVNKIIREIERQRKHWNHGTTLFCSPMSRGFEIGDTIRLKI